MGTTLPSRHTTRQRASTNTELRIVSANVRGFHTNVGELTHRFVGTKNPDIVFVTETFLDDNIPPTYARIQGYSTWIRKDRSTQGCGVALCHKTFLDLIVLDTPIPERLEMLIFKIKGDGGRSILCMGCYRPPTQGIVLVDFITENIDHLMTAHQCENVLILGDLNPPGIQNAFESLLTVFDLQNHISTNRLHLSRSDLFSYGSCRQLRP